MCIYREQVYLFREATGIQILTDSSHCREGFVCYAQDSSEVLDELIEMFLSNGTTYLHPNVGESWDYTYESPPDKCHRPNPAMRDWLNQNNVSLYIAKVKIISYAVSERQKCIFLCQRSSLSKIQNFSVIF